MRLSCNFVNVYTVAHRVQYTFTRVHARIPNGHPREERREEKHACRTSRRTSRRESSCVSGWWQAERESRRTRRHPRDDPRLEVGEDVRVGVGVRVGVVEFQLKPASQSQQRRVSRCTLMLLQQRIFNFRRISNSDDVSTFSYGEDKEYLNLMT